MDDLLRDFLTETVEGLSMLDQELVKLEKSPNDPELLANIFRTVHTIKGTCGFLGLPRLESVAHSGENLLGKFRDGDIEVTPEAVTLILEAFDVIKMIVSTIEETEAEPEGDDSGLISRLDAMVEGGGGTASTASEAAAAMEAAFQAASAPEPTDQPADQPAADGEAQPEAEAQPEDQPEAEAQAEAAPPADKQEEPKKAPPAAAKATDQAETPAKESAVAAKSIRVNVDLLEELMNMVSELVLTRNQLLQILRMQDESDFAAPLQRLNHVTSELQEGVMQTRMQPVGNAWAKLPRIIRDLSLELGKSIELQMLGEDTELDRQLLEMIKDPLTHMVRNSADHGIEMPEERVAAGKPKTGHVILDARHEGGHIVIEIKDDGKGLPLDRIKEKAIANGLATELEIEALSDQQIQQFIMRPGFSTAEKVTNVSGRGVGMDVVRTNIEKIGGTVELTSVEGRGSTFTIKIPLTLAIVNALIIECGGERFAIPQISVLELVRTSSKSELQVEWINNAPVLRLRNRLLPLVSLRELLKFEDSAEEEVSDAKFVIVTQVGTYTFGIIVDRVFDTEEIVVKPVAPILRDITMFSGNTILGDGSVVMILDPNGIAMATGEVAPVDSMADQEIATAHESSDGERMAMLLFKAEADGPPIAVPLALVARLEEIDAKDIEISDGKPVVQYRGKLMPLVPVDESCAIAKTGHQPTLVFADGDRTMGLVVAEIVDIVEDRLNVELGSERPGYLGTAIIADAATDIIDAGHFLSSAFSDWVSDARSSDGAKRRVLLVDDSPFFRNLLSPLLQVAGYQVTTVESGDKALELCQAGQDFDIILSDIEMPGMTGFEFAEAVKSESRWQEVPMVALSHAATVADLDRGRAAGFSDYVAKFDRDALLQTLAETLSTTRGAA